MEHLLSSCFFSGSVLSSGHTESNTTNNKNTPLNALCLDIQYLLLESILGLGIYMSLICNLVSKCLSILQKEINPFGFSHVHIFIKL